MQCNNWIQNGLLYTAGELNEAEQTAFTTHLGSCEACQKEMRLYTDERSRFFTSEILLDTPTPNVDLKIREACMKIPRPAAYTTLMTFALRKVALPAVFLFIGLGVPLYVAFNINNAHQNAIAQSKKAILNQAASNQIVQSGVQTPATDSLNNDSASQAKKPEVLKPMGDMSRQGVIPVDLQNR
jgi:anti-sigma factor RsiW